MKERFYIKLIFAGLAFLCLLNTASGQSQTISVGVFEFQDESGAKLPAEFTQKIARELAQKMNAVHKDVLARPFNAATDVSLIKAMNVEQLGALGKQHGVKFIIRGGLLAASDDTSSGDASASVQLYADIVSVETSSIKSVRAEGSSGEKDKALQNAIGPLAELIHQAIISPAPENEQPQTPDDMSAESDPKDVDAAESDEELQQLIAQAETLVTDGSNGNAERLASLSESLATLKTALKSKATLLEAGKDTESADQKIAAQKEKLQAALSSLSQDESPGQSDHAQIEQPSGEKKNMLARINEYAGEALGIIQKIQEMRAALRSESKGDHQEGISEPDPTGEVPPPAMEPTEEISGVVTEMGEPVAGVTVTEPESGANATTDSDGSYALQGVAAGRLTNLVLTRSGRQLAKGRINLLRGRASIADFELKPKTNATTRPTLRIIPSTVQVARIKTRDAGVGVLKGTVQDAQGRPLPRALVNLKGFAIARTNSQGQYVIRGVPPGTHRLIVHRSGLKPKTEIVRVAAKKNIESKTQFVAADKIPKAKNQQPVLIRGTGNVARKAVAGNPDNNREGQPRNKIISTKETSPVQFRNNPPRGPVNNAKTGKPVFRGIEIRKGQLRGRVLDAKTSRPIPGAIVSLKGQRNITSDGQGFYAFDGLSAGAYQVIARKGDFLDNIASAVIRPGETTTTNIRLNPKPRTRFR